MQKFIAASFCVLQGILPSFVFTLPISAMALTQHDLQLTAGRPSTLETTVEIEHYSYYRNNKNYFQGDAKASEISTAVLGFYQNDDFSVDGRWFFSQAEEFHYFDVAELSYKFRKSSNAVTTIGRHMEEWSYADQFWGMGLWQPRFYWDKLKPEENGLFGVFHTIKPNRNWNVTLYGSYLYVPELGPQYREEGGTVRSKNPWFRTPPPLLELFDQETEITAQVDEPEISDLIFKPSLGFILAKSISKEEKIQFAYAYKPMNQLLMTFDYKLLPTPGDWKAHFNFHPMVVYHQIATLAYHRENNKWSMDVSWTEDRASLEERPYTEITQTRKDASQGSFIVTKNLIGEGRSAVQVYGGIIHVEGFMSPDAGENAQDTSLFENIPKFQTATKVGLSRTIYTSKKDRLGQKSGIEGVFDWKQKGGALMAMYSVTPVKGLSLGFSTDLIGMTNDDNEEQKKGFFHSYRANDRLQMDLTYVY